MLIVRELLTCERILRHQDTDDHDICGTSALSPSRSVDSSVVDEGPEDELGRLV